MKRAPNIEYLANELEPLLGEMGLELVDIEFKKERTGPVLRVFIDSPGGVDLDACSQASEVVSGKLDEIDVIKGSYNLEVSSPGVERRLAKARDFIRFIGSKVAVKIIEPTIEGRRNFRGRLTAADENGMEMEVDGQKFKFAYDQIKEAHIIIDWSHTSL